jgi:hypothetical protein
MNRTTLTLVYGMILLFSILLTCCKSYQVGGTNEPREAENAMGVSFVGDSTDSRIDTSILQNVPSYFVSAQGNNSNYGLSESAPLRSLGLAYEKASAGTVKRITVIGTLNYQSETGYSSDEYVFNLLGSVKDGSEILITGRQGENARLSGTGSKKSVVGVFGTTRFTHIEISGGELNAVNKGGNGITFSPGSSAGIIGIGTIVRANKGSGVYIYSTCILDGGDIKENEASGVFTSSFGEFIMRNGYVRNNKSAKYGGGVCNFNTFTMTGGTISGNSAAEYGGGVCNFGTFTMMGGTISGNSAVENGGGVSVSLNVLGKCDFTMTGGTISGNKAQNGGGVFVFLGMSGETIFTMSSGTISKNTATEYGGGVYVAGAKEEVIDSMNGGIFRQSGGSITDNSAQIAGGVYVGFSNGRYDKTGGTVSGNTATHYVTTDVIAGSDHYNIVRRKGSLGSGR